MKIKNIHKLGIIAGGGNLPWEIIFYCEKEKIPFFVIAIKGFFQVQESHIPLFWAGFGDVGKVVKCLKQDGVSHLIFAGYIARPNISLRYLLSYFPDCMSIRLLRETWSFQGGDNSLLYRVQRFFESEGFIVLGAHELIPSLIKNDVFVNFPTKDEKEDIQFGRRVLDVLSPFDVGQSIVIKNHYVIAIESFAGTEVLLQHVKKYSNISGAVLIKQSKKSQNLKIDMPTVGPKTVESLADSGMRGMALESGKVILLEPEKIQSLAKRYNLFITYFSSDDF